MSDDSDQKVIFSVPEPFTADSPGDCYLQSAEGHQFKVIKSILSLASSVFRDMFSLPQNHSSPNTLPIVPITEDSSTLLNLLLLIYPPGDLAPSAIDLNQLTSILTAHEKYDIPQHRLYAAARELWRSEELLSKHGLQMYAMAWRMKLEREAKVASRYTHILDLDDAIIIQALTQQSGSLEAFISLAALRRSREIALDKVVSELELRRSNCLEHGLAVDNFEAAEYWRRVAAVKNRLRVGLQAPYPAPHDPFKIGETLIYDPVPKCSGRRCHVRPILEFPTVKLARAVESYPQEIEKFVTD